MPDSTLTPDAFMQQQTPARNAGLTPDAFMQSEQPAAPSAAEQPGFFRGLWDTVNPLPAIEHYAQLGIEEQRQIHDALERGDYKTAAKTFAQSLPGVDLATDIGKAQADQFHQAYQDFTNTKEMPNLSDRLLSASGHVAAGSLPMLGPAAAQAGENIGTPGKTAYGAGQAAGLLLPFGASRLAEPLADVIRTSPPNDLLAQTTKRGRALLKKQGPAVEAAGLTGIAPEVEARTAQTLARTGPAIGAEVANLDALNALPDAQRMYNSIQDLRRAKSSSNGVPLNKAYDARLAAAQQQLLDIATNPQSTPKFSDYDSLLNEWQEAARPAYLSEEARSSAKAMKGASARIREVLRDTQGTDALNALNDEFAANKAANDLATLARPKLGTGGKIAVKLGSTLAGGAVGHLLGSGDIGAWTGLIVAPQLEKALMSGSIRRMPAAFRNSIADALARGDMATAGRLAGLGGQMGAQAQTAGPSAAATVDWMRSQPAAVAVP